MSCSEKPVGRDCLQAGEKLLVRGMLALASARDRLQPIVVAIVPVRGRGERRGFQIGLILFFEERVLCGDP